MARSIVALALLGSASAYVAPVPKSAATSLAAGKADLAALCAENPSPLGNFEGIWDPLGCADMDFWGLGNEATIGYLRHAEIKHGRTEAEKKKGLFAEINNGRLAMIGLFSLTNEFAVKAWPVLAICGFLQQYNKRKTV
ncbi:chlorophyll A-B binding protein [Aureococcus anophagefferens]|nr:chlorophyll A-B binding protein [Aureococcus anophagefferens]